MKYLIPIILFLSISVSIALVQKPTDEEAMKVSIARSIMYEGKIACPIWESTGLNWIEWKNYYYSQPPLAYILLAQWFQIFDETILNLRLFSILMGLIGLFAWGCFYNNLKFDKNTVFLAVLILSVDFIYTRFSASGRPYDITITTMMGLALASYLYFREDFIESSLIISNTIVALSGIIHPNGFLIFVEVMFLMIYLDRKNIKFLHIVLTAIPYIIVGSAYIYWITRDFQAFQAQFLGNIALSAQSGIWNKIYTFFRCGFGVAYGWTIDCPQIAKLLSIVIAIYTISIFKCKNKILLYLLAIHSIWFCFGTSHRWPAYITTFIPLFAIITVDSWKNKLNILYIFITIIMCAGILSAGYRIRKNDYKTYKSEMTEIKKIVGDSLTYGSADSAFELGFDNLKNDIANGYYTKEFRRYYIVDQTYRNMYPGYKTDRPDLYKYIMNTVNGNPLYKGKFYELYENK